MFWKRLSLVLLLICVFEFGLAYDGLPLFMFTLIGGWLVRDAMLSPRARRGVTWRQGLGCSPG